MNLGQDRLERSVAQFRMPEPAIDGSVARPSQAHRRDRAAAAIVAIAVLALALAVLGRSFITTQPGTRNDHPAPPWRTADVDGIAFTNPGGWHLTGYFNGAAARRDREARTEPFRERPYEGMPDDGAILVIDPLADGRAPAWPTRLTDDHRFGARVPDRASWSEVGRRRSEHIVEAVASFGDATPSATRDALTQAFSPCAGAHGHHHIELLHRQGRLRATRRSDRG